MKPKTPDEFEEFDKVMGGLLSVPYSELQRKLAEEKREKEKEKEKERRATSSPASPASSTRKKPAG